jgi:hypothetical protein
VQKPPKGPQIDFMSGASAFGVPSPLTIASTNGRYRRLPEAPDVSAGLPLSADISHPSKRNRTAGFDPKAGLSNTQMAWKQ